MDGIGNVMERLTQMASDIAPMEMLVREEIGKMDEHTFWTSVCHSVIADSLEDVPEGTHLFQCAWNNREIFNERNNPHHYLIAKDPGVPMRRSEPKPEIQVNIAQLARFAMPCPYEGLERCPRRNFRFASTNQNEKRRDAKPIWEDEKSEVR